MPAMPPASARCHTRTRPDSANSASTAEIAVITESCATSSRLRLKASPTTPASGPRNSIGRLRATVTTATRNAECVAS